MDDESDFCDKYILWYKKFNYKLNFQPGVMKKNERIFKKRNGNNL